MCRTEVGSANRRQKKKKKCVKKGEKFANNNSKKGKLKTKKKTREENAISAQTHTFSGAAGKKTNVNVYKKKELYIYIEITNSKRQIGLAN